MTTYIPSLTLPNFLFANPAASVLCPVVLGNLVGWSISRKASQTVYGTVRQPPLNPPGWLFGPVWTVLYAMMGYAAHRAHRTGLSALATVGTQQATRHGLTLYTLQLGLNLVWMPLFFGLRRPVEATADIVALTGTVGYLTWLWGTQVDAVAGWMLVPYLGWLGFATYLSAGIGILNNWDLSRREVKAD